ncbi:phosphate regulon sensor histidine kinase PhoR [Aliikangiella sp. G2MR2-5]|uniref:phosphate regulon sensor histidine kinase PhoR n=1 Tax=Aliikangiella sp. G2MR2-5 TaxID=2788943 RepID=UPI0018A95D36|nr:phosphate regulon sensor histidine kinase PhoR [Aliikangiella sp. G2MR2-5]
MNNAWTVEFSRILVVVTASILIGLSTGYWTLGFLIPSTIYIGWTLVQIRGFERWIRLGAKTNLAPDSSGIWQLIVQHIHRIQKKDKERKARLKGMASRFEATISALPDATVVLNSHLEIEWSNDAAKEVLGIDLSKDLGQRFDNLIRLPVLSQLLTGKVDNRQLELISPVDGNVTLIVTVTDFGDEQKLVTARDVSQRIAVQKLRKAFIANASHELRTPLTVISGYLEMMDIDENLPVSVREPVNSASQQAKRMKKILDDLLILSKLEEKGHSKESGEKVNMPELVAQLTSDFEKSRAKGSHQFELEIDQSLHIKAVESEVYSLCQNLLSNAVKYSNPGTLIAVRWRHCENGGACLSVEDSGEGIAQEHISRLTERFYRVNVNRSRQVGGTGLGLSIVKHILENHGGHLKIESELGKGSTFTACFPAYRTCSTKVIDG